MKNLTGEKILPSDQSRIVEQAKLIFSPLGKRFGKQMQIIENQWELRIKTIEEQERRLVKSYS